jgi:hypothetical protein
MRFLGDPRYRAPYPGIDGDSEGFRLGRDMSLRSDMKGERHKVTATASPQGPSARPATPLDLPVPPEPPESYAPFHLPSRRWLKCAVRGVSL